MKRRKNITVKDLLWDKQNRAHITKHNVHPHHVGEATRDTYKVVIPAKRNRIMLIGRCGRRILTVVLAAEGKRLYVVSARDASPRERSFYRKTIHSLSDS